MAEEPKSGKLYYAGVFRADTKPAFELCSVSDLSHFSYFTRSNIAQFLTFFSKTVAERTQPGQRQKVEEEGNVIYSFARSDGLTGVVVTDKDYPQFTAHKLVSDVLDVFSSKYPKSTWSNATSPLPVTDLQSKFEEFADSRKVKGIAQIQRELADTKVVLHKTIENVLERGEKLDNLVAKSDGLSASSRAFYTTAKKQNSCCAVM